MPDLQQAHAVGRAGLAAAAQELAWAAVAAAALVTPLAFNPRSGRVFEPEKLAWLTLLALVLSGAAVAWMLAAGRGAARHGRQVLRQPLFLLGLCSLASSTLSWALGPWPQLGFWGSYRRGQGLLATAALWLLFFAAAALARRPELRGRLWRLLLLPAPAAATYALLQRAGIDSLSWSTYGSSSAERAFGSLGNPNFLAAYLAYLAPLALALGAWAWPERREGRAGLLSGAAFTLLACLAGLAATASRGAILGAGAGLSVCLLLPWSLARPRPAARLLGLAALGLGLGLLGLGWRGLEGFSLGRGRTVEQRLLVWQASARLLSQADARTWLLGQGPESLPLVLGSHVSPRLVQLSPDQYFDRAHNRFWDALATRGLTGLAAEALLPLLGLALCLSRVAGLRTGNLLAGALGAALAAGGLALAAGNGHLAPVLAAPAALLGLLGVWAWALRAAPDAPSGAARGAGDASGSARGSDVWLLHGSAGLLAAQLLEGAVGLSTVAADLAALLALAALAGLCWGESGEDAAVAGARSAEAPRGAPAGLGLAAWRAASAGMVEGLALAAVFLAPILLPDPARSLAHPALFLIPAAGLLSLLLLGGEATEPVLSAGNAAKAQRRRGPAGPRPGGLGIGWRAAGWGLAPCLTVAALGLAGEAVGAESLAWALGLLGAVILSAVAAWVARAGPGRSPGVAALALIPLLMLGPLAWRWVASPLLADRRLRIGQELAVNQDLAGAAEQLAMARRLWPAEPTIAFVQASIAGLRMEAGALPPAERETQFALAREVLEQAGRDLPLESLLTTSADLHRSRGDLALAVAGDAALAPPGEEAGHWWSEAGDRYRQALARYPLSPPAWLGLAAVEERLGRSAEARRRYEQAWELNAGSAPAAAGSLRTALALGDWPAASAALERALGAQGVDRAAFAAAVQDARGLRPDAPGLAPATVMVLAATGAKAQAEAQLVALRAASAGEGAAVPPQAEALLQQLEAWLAER